jgi:uncharacterized membrane protein YgdD (TMEM256/DUF423 family)
MALFTASPFFKLAAVSGGAAVLLGAFGAHGLAKRVDAKDLKVWETAAHYHLVHSVALLVASAHPRAKVPALLFTSGMALFSGSLYAMVLTGHRWLGAVTPVGGLLLTGGWLALLL